MKKYNRFTHLLFKMFPGYEPLSSELERSVSKRFNAEVISNRISAGPIYFNALPDIEFITESQGNRRYWPVRNFTPDNWPPNAPPYNSPEGWEYEKEMKRKRLITELSVIPWLASQADVRARIVAQRLKEII